MEYPYYYSQSSRPMHGGFSYEFEDAHHFFHDHSDVHTKPSGAGVAQVHSQGQLNAYFDACSDSNKLLVIEFTAAWCGPCRFLDPTFKDMAADYTNVQFIKVDVDELMSVAQQFNAQTLPAFVLVKNGREVDKVTGVKMDELQLKIEKHRN